MRAWVLRMRWLDLLFAHWPVDVDGLAALLPAGLELDLRDGQAWLGIVPFTMADVAPRGIPALGRFSRFPEINVRTYVRRGGVPGIYFLSLDAASHPTVEGARRVFHLPYFHARMSSDRVGGEIHYRSKRVDRRGPPAIFDARYRPIGPPAAADREAWRTGSRDGCSSSRRTAGDGSGGRESPTPTGPFRLPRHRSAATQWPPPTGWRCRRYRRTCSSPRASTSTRSDPSGREAGARQGAPRDARSGPARASLQARDERRQLARHVDRLGAELVQEGEHLLALLVAHQDDHARSVRSRGALAVP